MSCYGIKMMETYGFKSDHISNGSNKLFIILSIMFMRCELTGFNPEDLLLSTIFPCQRTIGI